MDWISVATVVALTGSGVGPGILAVLAWRLLEGVRAEHDALHDLVRSLRGEAQELKACALRMVEESSRLVGEPSQAVVARVALETERGVLPAASPDALEEQGRRDRQQANRESRQLLAQVDSLTSALAAATDRSRRFESRANAMAIQVEELKDPGPAQRQARPGAESVQASLQARLDHAESEGSKHAAELEALRAQLSRVLTEKEFIEERFLRLTGDRGERT
ncbi:MAG: hypothetical protein KGR99_10065 [Betaproteobacteria bacterium]|uniref:hypothetical protein n=1 Tax=Thiomonas sp. FB-6 TaxID=1158291 RepID=UPI00036A621F|nr:hypothetical protein [Thiomonas sp. FB-6]MBU6439118.1 hypothetical protein [Betaproteobacteria bacterium]MBU6512642.1 hypothetical protein [Betaproteobacteria bacterium]MDE2152018.1 hypothetical protein [Betaproteobacteria bacterium]